MNESGAPELLLQVDRLAWRLPVLQGYLVRQAAGYISLLDDISFDLYAGEMLALVGESGSGKSSLARAIVQLERPDSGRVLYRGQDLVSLRGEPLRRLRRRLQLIFQDARAALDPTMKAGEAVADALETRSAADRSARIEFLLGRTGLAPELAACLPGALSDEQCRRLTLARALAAEPDVILYDAPGDHTGALSELRLHRLLKELQRKLSISFLLLERDAGLAFQFADRAGILYAGRLVELAGRDELLRNPLHPYSQALLSALPAPASSAAQKAAPLPGEMPAPGRLPPGCRFHPRCRLAQPVCREADPQWRQVLPGHWAACHMV